MKRLLTLVAAAAACLAGLAVTGCSEQAVPKVAVATTAVDANPLAATDQPASSEQTVALAAADLPTGTKLIVLSVPGMT